MRSLLPFPCFQPGLTQLFSSFPSARSTQNYFDTVVVETEGRSKQLNAFFLRHRVNVRIIDDNKVRDSVIP